MEFCTAKLVCDGVELTRGVNWSEAETASTQCNDCRRFRANTTQRHYCTVRMPNGEILDWILWTNRHALTETGGVIVADWREVIPEGGWLTRPELLREVLAKATDKPAEPNKPDRPTTKVHVPEPRWYTPTPKERLSESPTRKALRRNKLVDFDACELSSYGPVADLEFHHTLDFAVCAHHYKRLDWAADINNGFLMIGCLNNPMKRGFHWEMDGPCAYYVPPEGEDYPDWMKVLRIPHFWIEPTPEQVKYILLASDHAMGVMY